jgi:Ca2+-binding EF-hand superfamily protein
MKTPADVLVADADLSQAALKIQKLYRGRQTRKEMEQSKGEGGKPVVKGPAPKAGTQKLDEAPVDHSTNKMVTLFSAMDSSGDGVLQTEEFVAGIEKIPGISGIALSNGRTLDHGNLLEVAKVIDVSGNGTINYLEFLQAFSSDGAGKSDIADTLGEDITTVLFRHRHAIRRGCHYLDEDGHGTIRAQDFQTVLQGVNSALSRPERTLTNTQISLLVEAMSTEHEKAARAAGNPDREEMVDYEFFLRSFVILDVQNGKQVVKKFR